LLKVYLAKEKKEHYQIVDEPVWWLTCPGAHTEFTKITATPTEGKSQLLTLIADALALVYKTRLNQQKETVRLFLNFYLMTAADQK
jgi:hypothetical protein